MYLRRYHGFGQIIRRQYSSHNLLQQAHRALNEQNLVKAKTLFEQLASEPDASVDTHYNLGVVEWLSKRPKDAVKRWQAALELCGSSPDKTVLSDCRTNLANYYLLFEPNLKLALEHLKAASELSPDDGEVKYNYGLALEKDDQLELALENYLRAEELGVKKNIDALIRNAGGKLMKQKSELPPSPEELAAEAEPMPTVVDYGPKKEAPNTPITRLRFGQNKCLYMATIPLPSSEE